MESIIESFAMQHVPYVDDLLIEHIDLSLPIVLYWKAIMPSGSPILGGSFNGRYQEMLTIRVGFDRDSRG